MKAAIAILIILLFPFRSAAQETCEPLTVASCGDLPRGYVCLDGTASPIPAEGVTTAAGQSAVVNTFAGLPLIGSGVIYTLLGDVQLVNTVSPEDTLTLVEPVMTIASGDINLRSRPGTQHTVLASVPPGTQLPADSLSPDREWLRVTYEDTPAWVFASLVYGDGLDQLPVMDGLSSLQAFDLVTGNCAALVIDGLETQPVRLTINEAALHLLDTVVVQAEARSYAEFAADPAYQTVLPEGVTGDTVCRATRLIAVDGEAWLDDYAFGLPRGFETVSLNCGTDAAVWAQIEAINPAELAQLDTLLPEQVNVPTALEVAQMQASLAAAVPREGAPEPGSQSDSAPPPQVVGDCSGFRPTHPLDIVHFGYVRFYWDPAPGATSYRVTLINWRGEPVSAFNTQGAETSVRVDTMTPLLNDNSRMPPFSYEVTAFQNGEVMCTTSINVTRAMDPDPDCPPSMWFSGTCEDYVANEP